jgi:diketogulonate reductase-like aldo/keto reductase
MKKSGVPRDEIFLVTKIWCNSHHPDDVERCFDGSLERLGTDYVDVFMMHYPMAVARYADPRLMR